MEKQLTDKELLEKEKQQTRIKMNNLGFKSEDEYRLWKYFQSLGNQKQGYLAYGEDSFEQQH